MAKVLIFIWVVSLPGLAIAQESMPPYLQELIEEAHSKKFHQERYWHLLLHYKKNLLSGYTSEVDDPGFFLSPNGKTNPEEELEATLSKFFSDELLGRPKQPAQCAFSARYHWLKEKLHFDESRLRPHRCEALRRWLEELRPASITLIFPSAYMGNPASMFGHSFLRVDQEGQTAETRILAYTINYAAETPPDAGIEFAFKGVFGGYKGFFSTIPYYLKVQEYRDIENRDIWEYRLNFSQEQILRLLRHSWELGNGYFDYYFFKENCAYHILSLLEVASPQLHLTDQFHFWTIPADTIRLLIRQEGLVGDVVYRPARSTQLKRKREVLNDAEFSLIDQLIRDPRVAEQPQFLTLAQTNRAFLLDVASDYLRYKSLTDSDNAERYKTKTRSILIQRSHIRIP
ncbi:MAG: DUF4105 domain-containing protein, partial [Nitrospirales bacterium]|nr:DUF4105 domain-containing protein [Nitrospirales bacterium]